MRTVGSVAVALLISLVALAQPTLAQHGAEEMFVFYGGGKQPLIGELVGSTWHSGATLAGTYSAIAMTASSIAMYNKNNGKLKLGIAAEGSANFTSNNVIKTGYTTLAGGCDSVFFYNKNTGAALTATLISGVLGTKHNITLAPGIDKAVASCDTLYLIDNGHYERSYVFTGGTISSPIKTVDTATHALVAATYDSLLVQNKKSGGTGYWGNLAMGVFNKQGTLPDFAQWDAMAGDYGYVMYYRSSTGAAAYASLSGGNYGFAGAVVNPPPAGYTYVVGAR